MCVCHLQLSTTINYHVGDIVTSLQRCSMVPGSQQGLLYSTISGGLGLLLPFTSKEDVEFFSHLEMHLRQLGPSLAGRDIMSFRSAYWPVKDTIDGDLCETFHTLSYEKQQQIASEMDFAITDITKKLDELRSRFL